jgi:hypothetical protein
LDNMAGSEVVMPPEVMAAIRQLWEQELKSSPLPW